MRSRRSLLLRPAVLLVAALGLGSCEIAPNYVERSDIEEAMARGRYKTVCVGLAMKDESLRRYATQRLQDVQDPVAAECVCEHVTRNGQWDPAVLKALESTDRDDMAACVVPLLTDPEQEDRDALVAAAARIRAPVIQDELAKLAAGSGDPATRARAVRALSGTEDPEHLALLIRLLGSDGEPAVRAAAADALHGQRSDEALAALHEALAEDEAGEVRLEALRTLDALRVEDRDTLVCRAMMEDEDPAVRRAAVLMYKGTRRDAALECLRERAFTEEDDAGVREALLEALKASPADAAADVLCDAIPFWLEHYAVENLPEKLPGTNITKAQNDRDWERSYECFQKAYARRGSYSCYGRQHIAHWFREVGGTSFIPKCPKTDGTTSDGGGGGAVQGSGVTISGS